MGFGDVKLALGIGWFLPYPANVNAIVASFYAGAAYGLFFVIIPRLMRGKKDLVGSQNLIPFGPFMVIGTAIAYFIPFSLW